MNKYTVLTWIGASLLAIGLGSSWGHLLRLRRLPLILLILLSIFGATGMLILINVFVQPKTVTVRISSPQSNDQVKGRTVRLTGTVAPPDARIAVVIRSETDDRWWVQAVVRPSRIEESVGHWSLEGFLGTQKEGVNKNFQLIALASADSILFNLITGRYLVNGETRQNVPLWNQSDPLAIRRIE